MGISFPDSRRAEQVGRRHARDAPRTRRAEVACDRSLSPKRDRRWRLTTAAATARAASAFLAQHGAGRRRSTAAGVASPMCCARPIRMGRLRRGPASRRGVLRARFANARALSRGASRWVRCRRGRHRQARGAGLRTGLRRLRGCVRPGPRRSMLWRAAVEVRRRSRALHGSRSCGGRPIGAPRPARGRCRRRAQRRGSRDPRQR